MKKIVAVAVFLFVVVVSNAFGQTTADEWFKKAGEYFDKGDYANAVTAYSEAIKKGSTNLDAYFVRGIAYYHIKNYDAAIADWNIFVKGAPNFFDVYLYRGAAYSEIKNYDAAIADFNTYIGKASNPSSDAYMLRGYAYGEKGIYHKAVTDYKKGLEKGFDPSGFNVDKSNKSDMWFLGAMYMEILVNRFLGKSDAVAKYENWLKTASDKNKVTRQEIEAFYRDNVRALIAGVVDEEFNKISWLLGRKYNAVLTRNSQNGQYILSYEGYFNEKKQTKIFSAPSLEALSSKMRNDNEYKADFNQNDVNEVEAQAALIPAVVYVDWKAKGIAGGVDGMALIKETLTNFYLNPSKTTYDVICGIDARYAITASSMSDPFARVAFANFIHLIRLLNDGFADKFIQDTSGQGLRARARIPDDPRFNIFSTPYRGGAE